MQKIINILCDTGTESAVLSNTFPKRKQEIGAILMLEKQVYFINDNKGVFTFRTVLRDAIKNTVQHYQHPNREEATRSRICNRSDGCLHLHWLVLQSVQAAAGK